MIYKSQLKYHHLSIPTQKKIVDEIYLPEFKIACAPATKNPYGIQWTRFDEDADYPDLVKECAHVAFEVESLDRAIEGERVITELIETSPGIRTAFISVLDAPVKFIEIDRSLAGSESTGPLEANGKRLKYHHTGLPCDRFFEDEIRVPHLKLAYLPGKHNNYGIEWLRFEADNENPDIIKRIPHVAFEVDDMEKAIEGEKVIYHSGDGDPGIVVAMIEVDGASVEFIELDRAIVGNQYDA